MELNKLYDIAEKENIFVYNYDIDNINGMFITINCLNAITLKSNLTSVEEKCTVAEELRTLLL